MLKIPTTRMSSIAMYVGIFEIIGAGLIVLSQIIFIRQFDNIEVILSVLIMGICLASIGGKQVVDPDYLIIFIKDRINESQKINENVN